MTPPDGLGLLLLVAWVRIIFNVDAIVIVASEEFEDPEETGDQTGRRRTDHDTKPNKGAMLILLSHGIFIQDASPN